MPKKQQKKSRPSSKGAKPVKVKTLAQVEEEGTYKLPTGCELEQVERLIKRYKCFEYERQVWSMRESGWAVPVSNFTCAIHMHIIDEVPTRLISVENVDKEEYVLHVPHDVFNSLPAFRKAVTGRGNYQWTGSEVDYMRYLSMMMDRMGTGRMILEPGMQREGFFCFVNRVCHTHTVELDRFGTFDVGRTKYYVPAANIAEGDSGTGYGNARRIEYIESPTTFEALNKQQLTVHQEHAMLASVHAVATVFSDHIRHRVQGFPLPYYYGPPGTGKDQLIKSCQNLFGRPIPALRLPAVNTSVAQVNTFAELRSVPLYLTEWMPTLKPETHAFIMGIWDGEGRKRGEKVMAGRSRFSTEDVPIHCTASLSGNYYPNAMEQLLDRLLVSEMPKLTNITMDMREAYRDLNRMNEAGFSYLLGDIVKHREEFIRTWYGDHYTKAHDMIGVALGDQYVSERQRTNMAILLGTLLFFHKKLAWGFTPDAFCGFLVRNALKQHGRRLSGDDVSNFWTCFIAAAGARQLVRDNHFSLDLSMNQVAFYWTDVFAVYMEQHRRVFGTPGQRDILNKLKQHECFVRGRHGKDVHEAYRIGDRKSTAYVFDATTTGTDLIGLLDTRTESMQDAI